MDRDQIRQALSPLLPRFTAFFRSAKEAEALGQFLADRLNVWEVGAPVLEAFCRQPEFCLSRPNMDFGGASQPFQPWYFLPRFLQFASERGPDGALDWVEKILSTTSAEARCICPVHGLRISEEISFEAGKLRLLPFEDLPNSDHKKAEQSKAFVYPGGPIPHDFPATSALVTTIHVASFFQDKIGQSPLYKSLVALQKKVDALAIGAGYPTSAGMAWAEYVDTDIQAACMGRTGYGGMHEFRPSLHVHDANGQTLQLFMDAYLRLPPQMSDLIDIAISRLNQAMRRQNPMDTAVDASIGLESLLGSSDDKNEITDRLSRRAAILIGGDLNARKETRIAVRNLYSLRSKVVHTGRISSKAKTTAQEITAKGIELGIKAVREIVFMGVLPPWDEWELLGRPDQT